MCSSVQPHVMPAETPSAMNHDGEWEMTGQRGCSETKREGAVNLAQDEDSCVVFGMPAQAIKLGGVDRVLPLDRIAFEVVRLCR